MPLFNGSLLLVMNQKTKLASGWWNLKFLKMDSQRATSMSINLLTIICLKLCHRPKLHCKFNPHNIIHANWFESNSLELFYCIPDLNVLSYKYCNLVLITEMTVFGLYEICVGLG